MLRVLLVFSSILFFAQPLFAQVDTAWVRRYNGPGNNWDQAYGIAVDGSNNVYVTGSSMGSGTERDYATVKYNPDGDIVWVRRYNGPGNSQDDAYSMAVDGSGNVFVTGGSEGSGTSRDFATIKYYPNGDTAWVRRHDGPASNYDEAYTIVVDGSGNAYVTGYVYSSSTNSYDFATIKYYPHGDTAWVRTYNGPGSSGDFARAIAVDDSGNVYVTGNSYASGTSIDYATIKYDSDGNTAWVKRYSASGSMTDQAYAIAVDDSGNVYVTGYSANVGTDLDYATIKYYPDGDTAWVRRYDGPASSGDWAFAIGVDGSGNVYVTGYSPGSGTSLDCATIKYYPNGDTAWVRRYNGPGNGIDEGLALVLDGSGNVYVTGWSQGSGTNDDYATIKYDSDGNELWVQRYVGPQGSDVAHAITMDHFDNVYVTGVSRGTDTERDYATVKYVPSPFLRGDANGDGIIGLGDAIYLLNYLFKAGPLPDPLEAGDANCDASLSLGDALYLLNFLFKDGPAPGCQ